jgi:hypothetical protein
MPSSALSGQRSFGTGRSANRVPIFICYILMLSKKVDAHDHSLVTGTSDARHDQRRVPSRCIIVREGEVIATGSNMTNETRNVSAPFCLNLKPLLRMADSWNSMCLVLTCDHSRRRPGMQRWTQLIRCWQILKRLTAVMLLRGIRLTISVSAWSGQFLFT